MSIKGSFEDVIKVSVNMKKIREIQQAVINNIKNDPFKIGDIEGDVTLDLNMIGHLAKQYSTDEVKEAVLSLDGAILTGDGLNPKVVLPLKHFK